MATIYWRGTAQAVAGVITATPGSINSGDTFTISFVGGRTFTHTATSSSAAEVCLGLVALLQASSDPLVSELTYEALPSGAETYVRVTGPSDGKPFDFSTSSVGGTLTKTTVTAATGPNWWTNANNWSGGAVPTNADTVICETDVPILYGIDAASVNISENTAQLIVSDQQIVGLPERDPLGYSNVGYRATFLEGNFVGVTVRATSGRIKVDTLGATCTTRIYQTGAPIDRDAQACIIKGNDASNVVDIAGGSVGLHTVADNSSGGSSASTVATVRITVQSASLHIGSLVTLTTLNQAAGDVLTDASITTVNKVGGTFTVRGTATVTTLNNDGGRVNYNSNGTITTYRGGNRQVVEALEEAVLDLSGDHRAVTITNCVLGPEKSSIYDPGKRRTHTNTPTIGMGAVVGITIAPMG